MPGSESDADFTSAFPVAFDAVARDRLFNLIEVLSPESFDDVHLVAKPVPTIIKSVRQRRIAEATVASRSPSSRFVLLNDDDAAFGVALLGEERRPETGIARTNNAEVRAQFTHQGRV